MAEEATTQAGASEDDPNAAGAADAGTSGDGGTGGTDSGVTSEALAQERAKAEQVQRDLQASRDRERTAREKAEAEVAKLRGATQGEEAKPLTRDELFAALDERERVATVKQAAESLRGADEFKHADKAILDRAAEFASVEALRAALETSHTATKAVIDGAVEEQVKSKLEEAAKQYGVSFQTPADPPATPAGELTIEAVHAMSMDEMDDYEAKNPGAIDAVTRAAFS